MPKPLSIDLRKRLIKAVESGMSARAAGRKWDIAESTATGIEHCAECSIFRAAKITALFSVIPRDSFLSLQMYQINDDVDSVQLIQPVQ